MVNIASRYVAFLCVLAHCEQLDSADCALCPLSLVAFVFLLFVLVLAFLQSPSFVKVGGV
jgi:hypothetical protein